MLALVAAIVTGDRAARAVDIGMVEFVRDLYAREIEMHNARAPVSPEAFFSLFTGELRGLMQAPRPNAGREPIGRILHAFFGWGVLPGRPVRLLQVVPATGGTDGAGAVRVDLSVNGKTRQIEVHPLRENGAWKVADISYDQGDSLRTYYRRITGR
jgi:hypothetical protein